MAEKAFAFTIQKATLKKLLIWAVVLGLAGFEIWAAQYVKPSMERITELPKNITTLLGWQIPFGGINPKVVINTWLVMGILVALSLFGRFGLKKFPGRRQGIFEVIIGAFTSLCVESLGERLGKKAVPYITTLFFFIMTSNWLLLLYVIPWIEEPTMSLSTTLGLGLISFFVSHTVAIREKGFLHYLQHYFEPMIEIGKIKIPNFLFCPLHIIGELGKMVSHSFRLFGNIMGGAIIYVVVTALLRHMILPPFLDLFFGIFIGVIQAFVFSLLAVTYINILAVPDASEEAEHAH